MDLTKGEEGEVTCDMVTPDHASYVQIHDGDVQEAYVESDGLALEHPLLVMLTLAITIVLAITLLRVYRRRIGEQEEQDREKNTDKQNNYD